MPEFKTVAIVGRYETPDLVEPILELTKVLESLDYKVILGYETAKEIGFPDRGVPIRNNWDREGKDVARLADVVIVIGGDGTMLGVAREVASWGVPLIGVNRGRVGFITDVPLEDMFH